LHHERTCRLGRSGVLREGVKLLSPGYSPARILNSHLSSRREPRRRGPLSETAGSLVVGAADIIFSARGGSAKVLARLSRTAANRLPRVRLNRLRAGTLLLVGSAYFIDLFLPWIHERGESASGWDVPVISTNGSVVLALVLVEAARARDVWRTTTSALLHFFLAAEAALLGVAGLVHASGQLLLPRELQRLRLRSVDIAGTGTGTCTTCGCGHTSDRPRARDEHSRPDRIKRPEPAQGFRGRVIEVTPNQCRVLAERRQQTSHALRLSFAPPRSTRSDAGRATTPFIALPQLPLECRLTAASLRGTARTPRLQPSAQRCSPKAETTPMPRSGAFFPPLLHRQALLRPP
jgi:hypothetical protein